MNAIDRWRAIVLYGRNAATYKIALGKVLLRFAAAETTTIDMPELANAFLEAYRTRLATPRRQMLVSGRRTLMERVVAGLSAGTLEHHQAVEIVARQGFNDVIPRFHVLPTTQVQERFYVEDGYRLRIDDSLIALARSPEAAGLGSELDTRWSLLETAFEPWYSPAALSTDGTEIFYGLSFERRAVALIRPVISGYQNGLCFYCSEPLGLAIPHVDHVVPRSFLAHDEIWNLVLTHSHCNLSKSDNLPPREYLLALYRRNEYYIASNHPIKAHLIAATGLSRTERRDFLIAVYDRALTTIPRTWRRTITLLREPLEPLALVE
jgi:hypothetical protein